MYLQPLNTFASQEIHEQTAIRSRHFLSRFFKGSNHRGSASYDQLITRDPTSYNNVYHIALQGNLDTAIYISI